MLGQGKTSSTDRLTQQMLGHPVVALRCALRSVSALAGLANNPVHPQGSESEELFVATVRALVTSWARHLYSMPSASVDPAARHLLQAIGAFDAKLASHYEHWQGFHYAMIGSMFDDLDHARRVSGFVALSVGQLVSVTTASSLSPEDPFRTSAFAVGSDNWRNWSAQNRTALEADLATLADGLDPATFVQQPLWVDPAHEALAVTMTSLRWFRLRLHHWMPQHLEAWVRERTPGALVLAGSAEASEERFRRIVALPDEFWRVRPAEDVMEGLAYALDGSLDNPHWGQVMPSSTRTMREQFEEKRRADETELARLRREGTR